MDNNNNNNNTNNNNNKQSQVPMVEAVINYPVPNQKINYPLEDQMLLDKIKTNPEIFKNMSNDKKTENFCIQVVTINGLLLAFVPKKTCKIILAALSSNPHALKFLTLEEQTSTYCEIAIKADGMTLEHVKDQTDKPHIGLLATEQNFKALQFIKYQTFDLCLPIIEKFPEAIEYVKFDDQRLYNAAVKGNADMIKFVPTKYQTEEMCIDSCNRNGLNLQHVEKQTPKICQVALSNNIGSCVYIKEYLEVIYDKDQNLETRYKDNIKVLIHDKLDDEYYIQNYDTTLLNIIFSYICDKLGQQGMYMAKEVFKTNKTDPELIRTDNRYNQGLFIINTGVNRYDLYEKTTTVTVLPGVLYNSTVVEAKITLITSYGLTKQKVNKS